MHRDDDVPPSPQEAGRDSLQALLETAEPLTSLDPGRAQVLLSEAHTLAEQAGDVRGAGRALTLLGGALLAQGQQQEAQDAFTRGHQAASGVGDGPTEARALNGLGLVARAEGQYGAAMGHYLGSLHTAQAHGDAVGQARALGNMGMIQAELGEHEPALHTFQEMRRLATASEHVLLQSAAVVNVAFALHELGRHDEVLQSAHAHLTFIREHGHFQHEVVLQVNVIRSLVLTGQAEQAVRLAEELRSLAEACATPEQLTHFRISHAHALLETNQPDQAQALLDSALQAAHASGLHLQERLALGYLGDALARRGAWESAYHVLRTTQALDAARRQQDLDRKARVLSVHLQSEMIRRESEAERIREAEWSQLTGELTRARQHLIDRASRDPLTGLVNRAHLHGELERALQTVDQEPFGVLFLDLDHFKHVNDTLGHDVGDELLQEIGRRLSQSVRSGDVVARTGGDEFTVMVRGVRHGREAEHFAQRLLAALAPAVDVRGHSLHVTASIGVAVAPQDGRDLTALQKHADIAMYRAKQGGRNMIRSFQPSMGSETAERVDVERDLREALNRQELTLHYQPLYAAPAGTVTGFEALVRWNHPTQGLLPPGKFIGVAEDSGLIVPLGAWVLGEACRQAAAWQAHGPVSISVNVSPLQFDQPDFLGTVKAALRSSGLDPRQLILELTESVVIRHPESAVAQLHDLRALGIRIALDDFGTGQSSLSLLRRLPIDILKIDRSFVQDDEAQLIAGVIVTLAHSFRMAVVAEGVETEGQLALVRALGCDGMQGHLLARPLSAEAATWVLVTLGGGSPLVPNSAHTCPPSPSRAKG